MMTMMMIIRHMAEVRIIWLFKRKMGDLMLSDAFNQENPKVKQMHFLWGNYMIYLYTILMPLAHICVLC